MDPDSAAVPPNPEACRLLDEVDWAASPLGPRTGWPPELQVLVDLMVRSIVPQHIVWGEKQVLLYNDGYIPVLDERHPAAFGMQFREVWPDVWAGIEPIVRQTYAGQATFFANHPWLLDRGDYKQQIWISFGYTPVAGRDGTVLGLHCIFRDTTDTVLADAERSRQLDRLREMFDQAPGFIALLTGPDHFITLGNRAYIRLVGGRDVQGKTVAEALPEAAEQGFVDLLDQVYQTGEPYIGSRTVFDIASEAGESIRHYVDFVYQPVRGPDGTITGIFVQGSDVTDHFLAEEELHEMSRSAAESAREAERERARLDALLEAAPVGIAYADANGRLVVSNQENHRLWGTHPMSSSVDEYREWKGWWADGSARHGRRIEPHEWGLARALAGEQVAGDVIEIEPFHTAGTRRTVLLRAAPVVDDTGAVEGAVVLQIDITDQVQSRQALQASEARFRTITDAMPQMVWSTTPDGSADYFNRQWYDFLGTEEGTGLGGTWIEAIHPDDRDHTTERWHRSTRTGELYEVEYRMRHRSGEYRWVLARGLPVRDERGEIVRWMGTSTEIHQHKLVEAALLDREAALREADQRKDEFLAMLAHELRNPLAPISTAAALLGMPSANPSVVSKASAIIRRQVGHVTDLVDDLLDVSRVTRGKVVLERETVDLRTAARAAIEQARPLIEEQRHTFSTLIGNEPIWVCGDFTRLTQVVANLLNNAAKYTPAGGQVKLEVRVEAGLACIVVADNGTGMSPTLVPHVFDLFTQAERTSDRAQGGLGIGLALVKSLVSLHEGTVEASSPGLGQGSTFVARLPMCSAPTMPAEVLPVGSLAAQQTLDIIIVDDNADAAETLSELLRGYGHRTRTFGSAEELLSGGGDMRADVFILDIGLPGMTGTELGAKLRGTPQFQGSRLIALSGYGQAQDRALTSQAGFDVHFVKPVNHDALIAELNSVAGAAAL